MIQKKARNDWFINGDINGIDNGEVEIVAASQGHFPILVVTTAWTFLQLVGIANRLFNVFKNAW